MADSTYTLLEEQFPLVAEGFEKDAESPSVFQHHKSTHNCWLTKRFVLLQLAIISMYSIAFVGIWAHLSADDCARYSSIDSPAKSVLRFEKRRIHVPLTDNEFAGPPRDELEEAWHRLLIPYKIRVSAEELAFTGDTSIELADGSGYLATLGVYHELHCLKRIRQFLYNEHYHSNFTVEEAKNEMVHLEHCVEYFRRKAMCDGEPSLTSYGWRKRDHRPTGHNWSDHECVIWEDLESWAMSRTIGPTESGILKPPKTWE